MCSCANTILFWKELEIGSAYLLVATSKHRVVLSEQEEIKANLALNLFSAYFLKLEISNDFVHLDFSNVGNQ